MPSGRVLAGGAPLSGVRVSDGCAVVATDARGAFTLPPPEDVEVTGGLVWICVPPGYRPVGPWYREGEGLEQPFRLERDLLHRDTFSFVYFTDPHLIPGCEAQPFEAVADEIAALRPRPAFWVCGGDVELQTGMGETFRDLMARCPFPGRQVAGNHDLLVPDADPWAAYRALFGPPRYSWDYGKLHYVVLAGLVPNPARSGWRNVEGELSEAELTWLEADLQQAGRPAVLFVHIPPVSTFPLRRGKEHGAEPAWELRGAPRLLRLCSEYDVRMLLSGHFHENERLRRGATEILPTGAVCGQWWEKGGRPPLNQDGSPKGYRVVHVAGDSVHPHFRALAGVEAHLRVVGPRAGQVLRGRLRVGVNVFDGDSATPVEYRLDEGDWESLRYTPQRAAATVFGCAHFWAGWGPESLAPGEHWLEVRARPHDTWVTERVPFTVPGPLRPAAEGSSYGRAV